MSPYAIQQSCVATLEESWTESVSAESGDMKGTVVCPKPRRLSLVCTITEPPRARPVRWLVSHQQKDCDAKAANELLDIILSKQDDTRDTDHFFPDIASSSPPFSCSPPRRVANPLIQDARFVSEKFTPVPPRGISVTHSFSSSNPAVRIEGFDCLDRDNQSNCSIPALA